MPWLREGSCPPERCKGRCCNHIGVMFDATAIPFLQMLQTRGISVQQNGSTYMADIPQTCQYLTPAGLCSLHPSRRPAAYLPPRPDICEEWPTEPSHLILDPDCGFSFRYVEEPAPEGASA